MVKPLLIILLFVCLLGLHVDGKKTLAPTRSKQLGFKPNRPTPVPKGLRFTNLRSSDVPEDTKVTVPVVVHDSEAESDVKSDDRNEDYYSTVEYDAESSGSTEGTDNDEGKTNADSVEYSDSNEDDSAVRSSVMLLSSHYLSNVSGYAAVTVDEKSIDTVAVGYAVGVFGFEKETASVIREEKEGFRSSADSVVTKGTPSIRNKGGNKKQPGGKVLSHGGKKSSAPAHISPGPLFGGRPSETKPEPIRGNVKNKSIRKFSGRRAEGEENNSAVVDVPPSPKSIELTPISSFNTYTGFMASPGEVIATVAGGSNGYAFNGIVLSEDDYDLYNPAGVSEIKELDWSSIYATIMVAIRVKDVPSEIRINSDIVQSLLEFFGANDTVIASSSAYSVPDEESGPVYSVSLDRETDSVVLTVDSDWYSGFSEAKRRAAKLQQFGAGESKKGKKSADIEERDQENDDGEREGDIMALSLHLMLNNPSSLRNLNGGDPPSTSSSGEEGGVVFQNSLIFFNDKPVVPSQVSAHYVFTHNVCTTQKDSSDNSNIMNIVFPVSYLVLFGAIVYSMQSGMGHPGDAERAIQTVASKVTPEDDYYDQNGASDNDVYGHHSHYDMHATGSDSRIPSYGNPAVPSNTTLSLPPPPPLSLQDSLLQGLPTSAKPILLVGKKK